MLQLSKRLLAAGLGLALNFSLCAGAHAADEVTGAGSTFIYQVLFKWATDYNQKTGIRVNYQPIGSGGGIAQIKAAAVDFGASDLPMKPEQLAALGLAQFPSVIGGVVPVINIASIKPGSLKFSGPLLASIFLGKITRWNDPAIVALNPGLTLPDAKINVVHRSDDSGTTYNWTRYLSLISPEWKAKVGEGTSVTWPAGLGSSGSEGVAAYVKQMPDSIGYVEYAYIKQNKLNFGLLQNKAGQFIAPSADSFRAAAASADWVNARDFDLTLLDAPDEKAYPITAATFIIMPRQSKDADRQKTVRDFFKWSLDQGQPQALGLDYAPLPDNLVKLIEASWAESASQP